MTDNTPVTANLLTSAHIDAARYEEMYARSVSDPEGFWGEAGGRLDWMRPYGTVKNTSFAYPDVSIRWFEDGTLNVCANCVDRHLETRGAQTAIIWEPDDPGDAARHITYAELHGHVCRMANVL
ncbi:acetyl-coenzyme A synthetase N-terminal domain-containing protein, partial [Maritimibacter sp. 55A14]|uniref:acetyl-coenzyme A synthetase N-terminal domain-containing protein n=1 Tax=Maritimibacter sp. 55A14 TaxID=2174844 RepID=UPI0035163868